MRENILWVIRIKKGSSSDGTASFFLSKVHKNLPVAGSTGCGIYYASFQ